MGGGGGLENWGGGYNIPRLQMRSECYYMTYYVTQLCTHMQWSSLVLEAGPSSKVGGVVGTS